MKKKGSVRADLYLLIATIMWGMSFLWTEYGLREIDLLSFMATRFLVAVIVLCVVFWKSFKDFSWKALLGGVVLGFILFAAGTLQASGQLFTTPEKSAFITSLQILIVPFASFFILKKSPSLFAVIGVAFAFIGMILITYGTSDGGIVNGWGIGETLTFFSAMMFGFHIIFVDKYSSQKNLMLVCIIQLLTACILFSIAAFVTGAKPVPFTIAAWTPILLIGIFATALSLSLMLMGQRHTPPTRAAVIYAMEPVFAFIFGLFIPSADGAYAVCNLFTIFGGVAVVVGVLTSEVGGNLISSIKIKAGLKEESIGVIE